MEFDIDAAREEITSKGDAEIDIEAAYKWGSRAIAAYQLYAETKELKWLLRGEDFFRESIEHSALGKDEGKTLIAVEKEIEKYRPKYETKNESRKIPQRESVQRQQAPSRPASLVEAFDDCGIPKGM